MDYTLHNFAYFGSQREPDSIEASHVTVHIANGWFAITGGLGGGGFTSEGPPAGVNITPSTIRQVHDEIIRKYGRRTINLEESVGCAERPGLTYHPIHDGRISANISYGDEVTDTETGRSFTVDSTCAVRNINRNLFYQLERYPHPPKAARESALDIFADCPLKKFGWKEISAPPTSKLSYRHYISVSGNKYTFYRDDNDGHYVENDGTWYYMRTPIYAPVWDTHRFITTEVGAYYPGTSGNLVRRVMRPVETDEKFARYEVIEDPESYHYNNVLTKY